MHREICVKDFLETAAPRILKFGTNIGYDYLYCVREIQHSHVYHSLYLLIFSFYTPILKERTFYGMELSVHLGIRPSVCQHSFKPHNSATIQDIFMQIIGICIRSE